MKNEQPTLHDVVAARRVVYRHVQVTPLHFYPGLSALVGADVHVKHENHHAIGAFKVRGGVNLAANLTLEERQAGLYTASTGNHGQSIAYAGKVMGTTVTVVVPEGANPQKVAAMRALGAEVLFHGRDFDVAREWAAEQAKKAGARFIGPTEPELIAGVGTYALEILEQLPGVEVVLVPIGGGSGASGVCLVGKTINPRLQVIGVQAEQAPAIYRSWKAGRMVEAETHTRAEGVATRTAYANTLRLLSDPEQGLDDFVLVSEDAMEEAICRMAEHTHNLAEHAGAAPLAAALQIRDRLRGRKVVLVQSGGNLMVSALSEIIARHCAVNESVQT